MINDINHIFQLALFWLSALACGRRLNDEHTKRDMRNKNLTTNSFSDEDELSPRSYGFKDSDKEVKSGVSKNKMPTASSKFVPQQIREPEIDDYGESEKEALNTPEDMDSLERLNEQEKLEEPENGDFEQVKKVKEISSIISLKPKERNKALDPITDQQGYAPMRFVRPMRDLSIIVRNPHHRHHPILIARQVPIHWIPYPSHHHHHHPKKPHAHNPHPPKHHPPLMPKHKPCKPCDPKVHKKHPHKPHKPKKPKKPKKKHKKEHCHHPTPKKPHHKKLIYYAPIPTAMNYYYGSGNPVKLKQPSNSYAVDESPEHEDVENDPEKPFHQEIEDDVEEHRLAELSEPYDESDPSESVI